MQNKVKQVIKYLTFGLKKKSGINFTGQKMFKNRSSGRSKRKYRIIDFYRNNYSIPFYILRIEYDPNRNANIALICYKNGILTYIIAPHGMNKNTIITNNYDQPGVMKNIKEYNLGYFISCVELKKNFGCKIARSGGTYCIILKHIKNKTILRLPSGEERLFLNSNKAMLGIISNLEQKFKKLKKAGNNFWIGKKPKVRGVAKNSVDHPHGGGRGKTSKLSVASNFTRKVLKGVPLYKKKKNLYILKIRKWKQKLIN